VPSRSGKEKVAGKENAMVNSKSHTRGLLLCTLGNSIKHVNRPSPAHVRNPILPRIQSHETCSLRLQRMCPAVQTSVMCP
jgi:hypothetical protein